MKILRLLLAAILTASIFTGCTEGEIPKYHLNLISPSFSQAYEHYSPTENETNQYELLSSGDYTQVITQQTIPLLESVTVVDDNISDENALAIIEICKNENIPVFFMMKNINEEILSQYDKAYCISANYTYIGEKFAEKINAIWQEQIKDKNKDKIFQFSVITPETLSPVYQEFYTRLIEYIELLGIPLQMQEEIFLTKGDVLDYCNKNKKDNEAYFLLESDYFSALTDEYEPMGDGVEILGIYFGMENIYANKSYMGLCFINYREYFAVRDGIMENIAQHTYPFENISHSVIGKTIYIEPAV